MICVCHNFHFEKLSEKLDVLLGPFEQEFSYLTIQLSPFICRNRSRCIEPIITGISFCEEEHFATDNNCKHDVHTDMIFIKAEKNNLPCN